jgi:hypothetical protein
MLPTQKDQMSVLLTMTERVQTKEVVFQIPGNHQLSLPKAELDIV